MTEQVQIYDIRTDAFLCTDIVATDLDDAIEQAFTGEGLGITDIASLERKFAKYVDDGGWCWIDCDGKRVVEIG